jgi:hypothetical protein
LILGEQLFSLNLLSEGSTQLLEQIEQTPSLFLSHFWQSNLQGLVTWLAISPVLFVFTFKVRHLLAK